MVKNLMKVFFFLDLIEKFLIENIPNLNEKKIAFQARHLSF